MNKLFNLVREYFKDEAGNIDLTAGATEQSTDGGGVVGGDVGVGSGVSEPVGHTVEGKPSDVDAKPAWQANFPESLEEEIANDPSLRVFVDEANGNQIALDKLLKSYVHAQRKIGEKGVQVPGENASDEEWATYYNNLRTPELDKYVLKNDVEDGITVDDEMFNQFRTIAHQNGLTQKQAQEVLNFYNRTVTDSSKSITEQRTKAYEEKVDKLKADWGTDFNNQMNLAQRAVKEFADENTLKYLKDSGLASDPEVIRIFAKIGNSMVKEGTFDQEAHGHFGMTKDDAMKKINKMLDDKEGAYWNADHASHQQAVEEMQKLNEVVYNS